MIAPPGPLPIPPIFTRSIRLSLEDWSWDFYLDQEVGRVEEICVHIPLVLYGAGGTGIVYKSLTSDIIVKTSIPGEESSLINETEVYKLLVESGSCNSIPTYFGLFHGQSRHALVLSYEGGVVDNFGSLTVSQR
jgi:hypothetical protein